MRPTFSIIFFTVMSGAGYGLLFLLGVALALGTPLGTYDVVFVAGGATRHFAVDPRVELAVLLGAGAVLASTGLVASLGHLGKPMRAWRALSQWRSSWLSREGVLALATYLPMLAIAFALATADRTMQTSLTARIGGALLALMSAATVYSTAHIYSSLKPIRAWHNGYVPPCYLMLGLYSGALWLVALAKLPYAAGEPLMTATVLLVNAFGLAPASFVVKWAYWRWLDTQAPTPDAGVATGLAKLGTVRSFEQPHTEENYLTHEMGFVLARKHARRLRAIALILIALAPIAMAPLRFVAGPLAPWISLMLGMAGVFVERWLFFAQARHAVIAYYGR
jgi:sulfite dehydrogenase (quinone) subunit SoeC